MAVSIPDSLNPLMVTTGCFEDYRQQQLAILHN